VPAAAARYDAWYATPLGAAVDLAEWRAVAELSSLRSGERALDAGCGTGIYTRRLLEHGLEVTGVDTDPEMLVAARLKAPEARLLEVDVTRLPFADGEFDLALAVTLICFVDDAERAVNELVRVTHPGGRVVLGELNRWSLWALSRRLKGWRGSARWRGAHFFSPAGLARMLRGAGAAGIETAAAAYLPPRAPAWVVARAHSVERFGRHLGPLGAAFSVARGSVT
jgi:ubiquinone/menaquinone biosynthesis C-methylase UbiE